MKQRSSKGKEVLAAVVLAATAAWAPSAWAQLAVSDAPVEAATADMDQKQFPALITQDTNTATSLTTTTQSSTYSSNSGTISSLDQALFSGVNSQNDSELLPVTQGLPCDSYTPMVTQIAPALRNTYLGAIAVAQQQETELQGEDFTTIASNMQAPAELAATQGVGQGTLAIVQELRLLRQQMDTLILVIAVDKLHQLDANVRSKMPRQGGGC